VEQVDLVVDCAPLFSERFAMNAAAMRQNKPVVMCAMHDMEIHITTMIPGRTPCLSCLYPEDPTPWKREFPVFGAVSGMVGCLGAIEAIKVIADLGEPLLGQLVAADLRTMAFRKFNIARNPQCAVCSRL
jgi:molybdopterin/thiamine biosynthesis adenylyltransferase